MFWRHRDYVTAHIVPFTLIIFNIKRLHRLEIPKSKANHYGRILKGFLPDLRGMEASSRGGAYPWNILNNRPKKTRQAKDTPKQRPALRWVWRNKTIGEHARPPRTPIVNDSEQNSFHAGFARCKHRS